MDIPSLTNYITMQNLLNCYVKETGAGEWKKPCEVPMIPNDSGVKKVLVIKLSQQKATLFIPVRYQSITERHLFSKVMYYQMKNDQVKQLDYLTLTFLLQKELSFLSRKGLEMDEFMLRMILSYQTMKGILTARKEGLAECYQLDKTFLESEQSLLIGHQVHPMPKSRQGIEPEEEDVFAPERKGAFQLHYFRAANDIVEEASVLSISAAQLIKEELKKDAAVSPAFKEAYCQEDGYALIPVHPLQARKLLGRQDICDYIQTGKLTYLGAQGRAFHPTSSVRTVYHPEASVMYKFSIPVKITNSLRINKRKELDRGVEVSRLLQNGIHEQLTVRYPGFHIVQDPAYINVKTGSGEETGFETVIRENPFQKGKEKRTSLIAALCQDPLAGEASHLVNVIHSIAERERISLEAASERWFSRYLQVSLRPLYWLYAVHGIALEAHQQNSVIQLDEQGYPSRFYYRDNQGYYFMESKAQALRELIPSLNEKSDTVCTDAIAEERFRYYVFFNHLFGLVNAFGTGQLIDEEKLLAMIKEELVDLKQELGDHTHLVDSLLYEEKLPCKANLLTRVHDMDELVGSLDTQSVYVQVTNPLAVTAGDLHEV